MSNHHTLKPGMELVDGEGATLTVDVIHEDGSIEMTVRSADGPTRRSETWTRDEICEALTEGTLRTDEGSGSEFVEER